MIYRGVGALLKRFRLLAVGQVMYKPLAIA